MAKAAEISSAMQDYLEAILNLTEIEAYVRVTDIAERLKIAKASVNQTLKKLKDQGFVTQRAYGPVELTEKGMEYAVSVRQRHKTLFKFLVEVLDVPPKIAEKDACLMEHVVSVQTMDKLSAFLDNQDHMGKSLQYSDIRELKACAEEDEASLNPADIKSLNELKIGQKGKVIRITAKGALLKKILEMGILNGTEITVKGFAPFGDPMEIIAMGYHLSIRKAEASEIYMDIR